MILDIHAGRKKRVLISMPPRHGKSTTLSHYGITWYLGRNPDHRVLFVSYQAEYAKKWGRAVRNTMDNIGKQVFGLGLKDDVAAANNWEIAGHTGGMETVGTGGALTGKGANLMVIDDPVKGREQALSKTIQDGQYDWYQSDVYSRLEPGGAIVVVATRWSYIDLIGRLIRDMQHGGEKWDIISLPAIAEEGDILGRKRGEALWPERYPVEDLMRIKKAMGEFWFTAEYQQRPTPLSGNLVKIDWFRRFGAAPLNPEMVVLSFDTAQKEKELSDYTVCGVWFVYQNNYYLVDVIRDQLAHPRLVSLAKNMIAKWKPHAVLVEDKGSGTSLIQYLKLETRSAIFGIEPTTDKAIRMQNESPAIEAGQVFIPMDGSVPWLQDYLDELKAFPNSGYKDQVDMTSQFLRWARERVGNGVDMW